MEPPASPRRRRAPLLLALLATLLGACRGERPEARARAASPHAQVSVGSTAAADTPAGTPTSRARRPNIVLILADDLGIGDLGCYNPDSRIPTPHIDAFSAQSRRFTDAHSPSGVCSPTRYGLLTGRYAWRTSLQRSVLWGDSPLLIDPERGTLASLCKSAGYRTACFGKWHLGLGEGDGPDYRKPLRPGPLECGFDTFEGIPASAGMPPYVWIIDDHPDIHATVIKRGSAPVRGYGGAGFWRPGAAAAGFEHVDLLPRTVDRAVQWIGECADGEAPFFLYLALTAPHTPWVPTRKYKGASKAGTYGDFVAMVDAEVGRVLTAIDEHELTEETLVIVTSDNGAHWEPSDILEFGHRANGDYRGQKGDAWEGGHRIPFLIRWPGHIPQKTTEERLFSLTDFYATLASLFELEIAPGSAPDSMDATPLWFAGDSDAPTRTSMVLHSFEGVFAMRDANYKFIDGLGSGGFSELLPPEPVEGGPTAQLYDLAEDPAEKVNLFATHPNIVERLKAELAEVRATE